MLLTFTCLLHFESKMSPTSYCIRPFRLSQCTDLIETRRIAAERAGFVRLRECKNTTQSVQSHGTIIHLLLKLTE